LVPPEPLPDIPPQPIAVGVSARVEVVKTEEGKKRRVAFIYSSLVRLYEFGCLPGTVLGANMAGMVARSRCVRYFRLEAKHIFFLEHIRGFW